MDFNDISHTVIKLLCVRSGNEFEPSETASLISGRYKEILIDEFQDTNGLQDLLAGMLTRGRNNLFMVGDMKQSIYRFRLAEPEIFQQYYSDYEDYSEDMEAGKPARVILSKNFRSRPEVIDAVNSIFPHLMIGGFAQIRYGKGKGCMPEGNARLARPMIILTGQSFVYWMSLFRKAKKKRAWGERNMKRHTWLIVFVRCLIPDS